MELNVVSDDKTKNGFKKMKFFRSLIQHGEYSYMYRLRMGVGVGVADYTPTPFSFQDKKE